MDDHNISNAIGYRSANIIFGRRPVYWFQTKEPAHEVLRKIIQATG